MGVTPPSQTLHSSPRGTCGGVDPPPGDQRLDAGAKTSDEAFGILFFFFGFAVKVVKFQSRSRCENRSGAEEGREEVCHPVAPLHLPPPIVPQAA